MQKTARKALHEKGLLLRLLARVSEYERTPKPAKM